MSSKKALKVIENQEMELLVSHDQRQASVPPISRRVIFYAVLFVVGLLGTGLCLWAMLYTSDSEEVVYRMGMERVANNLDDILSLLAIPMLMFSAILAAYAAQQLYLSYRRANDPEQFGRKH